jgi:hypothetical protein
VPIPRASVFRGGTSRAPFNMTFVSFRSAPWSAQPANNTTEIETSGQKNIFVAVKARLMLFSYLGWSGCHAIFCNRVL